MHSIRLYTCEADLEKALSSLDTYRHDLKERESKLHHLATDVRTNAAEKERLQEIIGHHQHAKERLCQEFDYRMYSLRNTVANLKEEKVTLKVYKSIHDQLQESQLLKPPNPQLLAATSQVRSMGVACSVLQYLGSRMN